MLKRLQRRARVAVSAIQIERRHRGAAQDSRPVFVDVGSAGGTGYRWRRVIDKGLVTAFAVDPQADYSARPWTGATQIKAALGERDETVSLWDTNFPQCSSVLEPNVDVLRDYACAELFRVVGRSEIMLRRADGLWREKGLPPPTLVKADVQGFELEVLKGFGHLLEGVEAIELESHFRKLYVGQALFSDVASYLDLHGFALRHLQPQSPFGGELVEANTFWVRRDQRGLLQTPAVRLWEDLNSLPPRFEYRYDDWSGLLSG